MSFNQDLLSVAEVSELPAGDEQNASWIDPGFKGVVRKIDTKESKAGKKYYPCIIGDETGSAQVRVSFFIFPKFKVGDLIEISGKGLRRTEYQGNAEVGLSKTANIHVLGHSAHHDEQVERTATSQPSVSGALHPVNGQSVGCAMNNALEAMRFGMDPDVFHKATTTPDFWSAVYEFASDHIRVARLLEHGKLAPSVKDRLAGQGEDVPYDPPQAMPTPKATNTPTRATEPARSEGKATSKPLPPPPPQAFPTDGPIDEQCPF